MRRFISILTLFLLISILHGCSSKELDSPEVKNNFYAPVLHNLVYGLNIENDVLYFQQITCLMEAYDGATDDLLFIDENSKKIKWGSQLVINNSILGENYECISVKENHKKEYGTIDSMLIIEKSYDNYSNINKNSNNWIYDMKSFSELNKTVITILGKFIDIESRLTHAYRSKYELSQKYGASFSTKKIESDINKLSTLGWKLTLATKKFFPISMKHMMTRDETNRRTEILSGFKTFITDIELASNGSNEALEKSIIQIEIAINKLDKAVNE